MQKHLLLLPVAILASACVTAARTNAEGSSEARIGQTVDLGGPRVTVLKVLEDSRCPADVECAWAGRIKLSVRIDLSSGTSTRELASDQPLRVADGMLELVDTIPLRSSEQAIAPTDYRFALKFSGGLTYITRLS